MTDSMQGASQSFRFYYTDPLAAAWMAKHFGMKVTRTHCFRGDGQYGESIQPIPLFIFGRDIENQVSEAVRYYIHPDSLGLLEPHDSDFITDIATPEFGAQRIYVDDEAAAIRGRDSISDVRRLLEKHPNEVKIIQRNGIPFHWPEREAV